MGSIEFECFMIYRIPRREASSNLTNYTRFVSINTRVLKTCFVVGPQNIPQDLNGTQSKHRPYASAGSISPGVLGGFTGPFILNSYRCMTTIQPHPETNFQCSSEQNRGARKTHYSQYPCLHACPMKRHATKRQKSKVPACQTTAHHTRYYGFIEAETSTNV